MNYIIRTFFYSFGLALLMCAWALDPQTAQFKDLLAALHVEKFWSIVIICGFCLMAADMVFSGKWGAAVEVGVAAIQHSRDRGVSGQAD